jgi:histidyl-tRNA synthetase
MTPTVARMIGARHRNYKKPIKWYSYPQMFRYEKPQKGRGREFYQYNVDIIGEDSIAADAELLSLLVTIFQKLQLTSQDVVIRVSDRDFWIDFCKDNGISEEGQYDFLQVIDKIERTPVEETRVKLGNLADKVFTLIEQGAKSPRLEELWKNLEYFGILDWFEIDLKIVRGLAYYTGVVFEAHDRAGEIRALAGGGRYNKLFDSLGYDSLPALGFGMGDMTIYELLKAKGKTPQIPLGTEFYAVIADEAIRPQALGFITKLRTQGLKMDYSLTPAKVGKQFQLAEERGCLKAIVLDAKMNEGKFELKDLKTRQQREVAFTIDGSQVVLNEQI